MDNQNQISHLITIFKCLYINLYDIITSYIKMKFFLMDSSLRTPQKSLISFDNLCNNSSAYAGYKLNLLVPTIYKPYLNIGK
jgi:hypothetical protein